MKKDNLEKFVRENRMEFDDREPSMEIWERINTPHPRKLNRLKIAVSVAATALLFVGAYFMSDWLQNKQEHFAQQPKEKRILIEKEQRNNSVIINQTEEKKIAAINTKHKKEQKRNNNESIAPKANEVNEMAEVKEYYSNEIENKKEEILNCTAYDPEIKTEIQNEFSPLDAAFNELKKDMKDNVDNTQIMEAMIQNYRTKLEILSDIKNQLCSKE